MQGNETDERLWTPWRMRYITGATREEGCIFCNRLHGDDDVSSLILHRGIHSFIIMNLFPYNTGHIMIVPNQHADDVSDLDTTTLHEMADLLPIVMRALKRVLNCQGFNVGLNVGAVAGAGVAEHLHQHVVPRWLGDANFMPILASTTALPELIPSTYAKIRAELTRELRSLIGTENSSTPVVFVLDDDRSVLLEDSHLPRFTTNSETSIWRSALTRLSSIATDLEVSGWAGMNRADSLADHDGLVVRGVLRNDIKLPAQFTSESRDGEILQTKLDAEEWSTVVRGLAQLAPRVMPPSAIDKIGDDQSGSTPSD